MAISPRKATHDIVKKNKLFTVNVLPFDMVDNVYWIGSHTSRYYDDKIAEAGLTSQKGNEEEDAISIDESIASFECKVVDEIQAGDHTIFLGEVISVDTTEEFYDTEKSM